jgi:hypothetical protein
MRGAQELSAKVLFNYTMRIDNYYNEEEED